MTIKVCITGLYHNDNQILVGANNDQESFWLDFDHAECSENHMTRIILMNDWMRTNNDQKVDNISRKRLLQSYTRVR